MKVNLQPHLKLASGNISKIVLLPGDPARVITIAKFLKNARKVAQNREFITYRRLYEKADITVTSTGIGCPSAAIAAEELANIGARVFIRIGTCGAIKKDINVGDLIIPSCTLAQDGTTKEYFGNRNILKADPEIFSVLKKSAIKTGTKFYTGKNRTHDAFYESTKNFLKLKAVNGLISSEMECSVIFAVAKLRGLKAGAILTVNTVEPFELVEKYPQAIYSLNSQRKTSRGLLKSIEVVLESARMLSKSSL